ncbi:MAG: HD domain-containing protein [Bifidobacteriaceae bacterium]|jgi:[protein-PII] uridylyltransferase|nr:HD domain-containing protein [Bifidobacteriaceae bacterium]
MSDLIQQAAEAPGGPPSIRGLGLARKGEGPWAAQWWAAGAKGRAARTRLLRAALRQLWDGALRAARAPGGAGRAGAAALGAVGSLGRGDLAPLSDLDLVVVHDGPGWSQARREDLARSLWYPIWDAGFDLDQSFRSLAECRRIASQDLAAATGLLSLAALAGGGDLAERAASAVLADWRGAARKRLPELAQAVAEREAGFGHLAFRLEGDIKEARGGLRDAVTLDALVASWLAEAPRGAAGDELARSRAYLLDVRDALQRASRRPSSILLMAEQDATARALDPHLTADQLMGNVAKAARDVTYALDTTMRRALGNLPGRAALPAVFVRGRRRGPRLAPLAAGLAELGGEIVFASPDAPTRDAVLPLRAARVASATGLGFEPLTLRALRAAPALAEPWPADARAELGAFLQAGERVPPVWEALDQAGLVGRLWPEWLAVRNQAQRNALHRHTVDRHQVEAVALLASVELGTAPPDLTAVATLFHDLGKRPGERDHAGLGALLAGPLFARMGYSAQEAGFMVALIRQHLTLARLATTRDPSAPATVAALVEAVDGRLDRLDALAALTEADARAAGPKAWTKLRAALIARLAAEARRALAEPGGG